MRVTAESRDRSKCVVCSNSVRRPGIAVVCDSTNCRRTLADRQAFEREEERRQLRERLNCPVRIAVTTDDKTRTQVVEDGRFSANEVIACLRRLLNDESDWSIMTIEPVIAESAAEPVVSESPPTRRERAAAAAGICPRCYGSLVNGRCIATACQKIPD